MTLNDLLNKYTQRNVATTLHVIQKTFIQSFFPVSVKLSSSVFQGFPEINLEFQGFQGSFRTKIKIHGFPGGVQTLFFVNLLGCRASERGRNVWHKICKSKKNK